MSEKATPSRQARYLAHAIRAAEVLSALMFAALFLTFVAQVFWRYALRDPLVWTLEVAGILFVTLSLFTAATQMPFREHVRLDLFLGLFPPGVRRLLVSLSMLLFAIVMLASLPDTVEVLHWMYRERTHAIGFNLGHLFVLMIFFVIAYVFRALWVVVTLWRSGSQDDV